MKNPVISALKTEFIPATDITNDPQSPTKKLMIVLHGLGDSSEGYKWLPSEMRRSDISYLLLNAPDAYYMGYSWFDIPGDATPGILRSREYLFRTVQELEAQGWKNENIALFGFSQGCLMVLDLALRYPKKFAAVIGISGYAAFLEEYPQAFSSCAKEQKILITHGSEDPMLPLHFTKPQMQKLQSLGLQLEWKEYKKEHTIDPEKEMSDIRAFLSKTLCRS